MPFATVLSTTLLMTGSPLMGPTPAQLDEYGDSYDDDDAHEVAPDLDLDDDDDDDLNDDEDLEDLEDLEPWEDSPSGGPDPESEFHRPARRSWDGGPYFSMGLSPMSTLHIEGFHPGIRYDFETGVAWDRGRARIYVGPNVHISQYYGRKKPSVGLDAVLTLSLRHVYGRVGAGTVANVPARRDLTDGRPMMGGLVGAGLVGRLDHIEGRLGLDYDVRMDTTGRVAQTVMIAMRISFGP